MTITANDLINLNNTYSTLSKKELDLNTACTIAQNINTLTNPVEIINKKREKIISQHAKKDSEGNIIQSKDNQVTINDIEAFNKKMNSLQNETIEVELKSLKKASFSDIKISPRDILPLIQNNLFMEE